MANILPTLKETKRYIAFRTIGKLDKKQLEESVLKMMGQIDYIKSNFKVLIMKNNLGIAKVNNDFLPKAKASLIASKTVTLYTSGLINKAKKFIGEE